MKIIATLARPMCKLPDSTRLVVPVLGIHKFSPSDWFDRSPTINHFVGLSNDDVTLSKLKFGLNNELLVIVSKVQLSKESTLSTGREGGCSVSKTNHKCAL